MLDPIEIRQLGGRHRTKPTTNGSRRDAINDVYHTCSTVWHPVKEGARF